jgi:hypothetical protein
MSKATEVFEDLDLPVNELEIDRRVQRTGINLAKVARMVKNYNPAAVGTITVSVRKDRSKIIIDGQHRWEATRRVTDNAGTINAHVFHGLTLAEEAQMFLDLNDTTQPPVIDKFKVSLNTDGPEGDNARDIQEILGNYGWTISNIPANGNVNCVKVVERVYALSQKIEADPSLIQVTILVVTRAWGNDRFGAQGPVFEGIARMFAEYGSRLDLDRLIDVMKSFAGPRALIAEATGLAAIRKGKVSMGVAEMLVEAYNKGRRSRQLEAWRARR